MATDKTTTSRRAVIAALAGAPIFAGTIAAGIGEAAASPTVDRTAWDRALAAYVAAQARVEAETDESKVDALADELEPHWQAVVNTPAPGLPEVVEKITRFRFLYPGTCEDERRDFDAILADLKRLSEEDAA